jgi:hypothetical protein
MERTLKKMLRERYMLIFSLENEEDEMGIRCHSDPSSHMHVNWKHKRLLITITIPVHWNNV